MSDERSRKQGESNINPEFKPWEKSKQSTSEKKEIKTAKLAITDREKLFIQEGQMQEGQDRQIQDKQSPLKDSVNDPISKAIDQTRPPSNNEKEINRCVFRFCRKLQGMEEYANASEDDIEPIMYQWYQTHLANLKGLSFIAIRSQLLYCWKKVQMPEGEIFNHAIDLALTVMDHPPQQDRYAGDERAQLLVRLCYRLQELGNGETFFLGYEKAGEAIDYSHTWAGKYLGMLVGDGILEAVSEPTKSANPNKRMATEYKFIKQEDI